MKKHYFIIVALLIIFVLPSVSSAQTAEELQAQINALMAQIQSLQSQLAQVQGQSTVWCHDFNTNIGVNSSGSEVEALQTALGKEGFDVSEGEKGNFDESTASAVSGLQQKYVDEILRPLGLKYGTGYLGKATRTKLNKLYGCGVTPSPVIPTQTCKTFAGLTCETGYRPYNAGEKDSQGCPIIKCISSPTPVPIPSVPIPIISEQVKCLFDNSTSMQECYSSAGVGCKDMSACVVDVKGAKGVQIAWKSTCGGYAYTTMDGNNEYAEFKCAASTIPTPTPTPTTSTQIQTPIPTIPKSVIPPSTVGTGTRKFKPIDPSRCVGIIETSCTIEPADIIKVSVYDEKGGYIDTRENNNSGMAGFVNLPYGNYTVVINAEGFEYYKASFTVCATCEEITTIYLKKTSTSVSQNIPPKITGGSSLPPTIQPGQVVNFSWNAQDGDKDNLFWSVNWGDGIGMVTACPASNPSNGQGGTLNTYHAWEQAGTYTVRVTVSDCKGGTDSLSVTVNVGASATPSTVTPSITVLSPNGGETWQAGNYYEVKWRNTTNWSVKIEIIKGDSIVAGWSPIDSTVSTHSIGLPLPLEAGSDYKIRITTIDTGIVDTSDAPFSIVAGTSGLKDAENLLASISQAVSQLSEKIKELTR